MENFKCEHCGEIVEMEALGTRHRNHCPKCLWSKHLDQVVPGDRGSLCKGMMEPKGLTFKSDGEKTGELMLVHECSVCGVIQKNRIAGDDTEVVVLDLFERGLKLKDEEVMKIKKAGIKLAEQGDEREVVTQLYGRPYADSYFKR